MEFLPELALALFAPWILFGVLSIFFDTCVNYIDEWLLETLDSEKPKGAVMMEAPGQLLLISGLFGFVVCSICVLLVSITSLKFAIDTNVLINGVLAGALEVGWLLPYFIALSRSDVISATPLFQTVPIFSLLFGFLFFAEVPTTLHVIAAVVIIAGSVVLNFKPKSLKVDWSTISLMLLAASIISFGYFFFKEAATEGQFITALAASSFAMGATACGIWLVWKPYRDSFWQNLKIMPRKIFILQLCNEGIYAASTLCNQIALVTGPSVVAVSSLGGTQPLITLAMGKLLGMSGHHHYNTVFSDKQAKLLLFTGTVVVSIGILLLAF